MRLIDADKLRAQIEAHEIDTRFTLTNYEYGHNTGLEKAEDDVDAAETVEAIPITYLNSRISRLRQHKTYAGDFAADLLEAIIKDYNKEAHND